MADKFLKIAITSPDLIDDEPKRLTDLINQGYDYIHLRKPCWDVEQMEVLIESLHPSIYSKLILHDYHKLAVKYNLGGVHLNARNPINKTALPYSVSCHSLKEIEKFGNARYIFLSPVYDSISKEGYRSSFNMDSITESIRNKRVVALGGVTPEKFDELAAVGFSGAAMLGYLWK